MADRARLPRFIVLPGGNPMKTSRAMLLFATALLLAAAAVLPVASSPARSRTAAEFPWPSGKRCAVSLTFDDARLSQPDAGIPLLDRLGIKATFYVSPDDLARRVDGWKAAVRAGHEVGNHTMTHPCTGNYAFSLRNALEDYTLERMAREIDDASRTIEAALGVKPDSFAYPCGQTFVGRGREVRSYVPLVAERFATARGWLGEDANDPAVCDLVQLLGMESDGKTFEQVKPLLDKAAGEGRWLILAGHEMAEGDYQTTSLKMLEALGRYVNDPANGIWVDTVSRVGRYIRERRGR